MAVKANSLTRLEAVVKSKRPVEADTLSGMEPFDCIVDQVDLTDIRPHTLHAMIRKAQDIRTDSIDDGLSRYGNDTITLTNDEKNFVIVHERDVRAGTLRQTASETFTRVDELLSERADDES